MWASQVDGVSWQKCIALYCNDVLALWLQSGKLRIQKRSWHEVPSKLGSLLQSLQQLCPRRLQQDLTHALTSLDQLLQTHKVMAFKGRDSMGALTESRLEFKSIRPNETLMGYAQHGSKAEWCEERHQCKRCFDMGAVRC